jgi:hypothetical protein
VNIDEVKKKIGEGNHLAGLAGMTMAGVRDSIRKANALAGVTHDSHHPHVQRGYALLGQADLEAYRVRRLLKAGVAAANEYREVLG